MARESFRLVHTLRVRWAEVDPQSIVFNANYLMYFDVAVTEYWRAIGFAYPEGFEKAALDTFAVKATLQYHAPARYDELLDLVVRVARIGRTSMQMLIEIHRGDQHLVSGELVYVFTDPKTRKPTPVPDSMRAAIAGYEVTPPERTETPPRA
jgi:acyl-CoA thioester hydrolase